MKHYDITCTERITLAPDHARKVMHPNATEKTYPVYTIDGERYIIIKADTLGGTLLTRLSDLHVFSGELNAIPAPLRVPDADMPRLYPQDIDGLTDITGTVQPRVITRYNDLLLPQSQYEGYTYAALPASLQNAAELFWEPGYNYSDPDFWMSYENPDPDLIYAVKLYDSMQHTV